LTDGSGPGAVIGPTSKTLSGTIVPFDRRIWTCGAAKSPGAAAISALPSPSMSPAVTYSPPV
jgi:hypothetical protein